MIMSGFYFILLFSSAACLKSSGLSPPIQRCSVTLHESLPSTTFDVTFESTYRQNFKAKLLASGKRHSPHVVFAVLPK